MDDRRVHGERTVQQDRLEKKVRVESLAGAESVCLCVIRKEQENRQGGRRERKPRRDRGSMCMLFSRQPRECLSSAAPFTLSQPEGGKSRVAIVTAGKTRYTTLAPPDAHALVTAYWS